jgi:hypothetical protein
MSTTEKIQTIDDIFNNRIEEPFFYNINFNSDDEINILYLKIKNIFIKGLIIHYGDILNNTINIDNITLEQFNNIKKYMLSIGIETKLKEYEISDIDYLVRKLIYDVQYLDDLEIEITSNWKTQYINKVSFITSNNNLDTMHKLKDAIDNNTEANFFLKINKPSRLKDFPLIITKEGDKKKTIINFDYAKIMDYPKPNPLFGNSIIR